MIDALDELRRAIEQEVDLAGNLVPLASSNTVLAAEPSNLAVEEISDVDADGVEEKQLIASVVREPETPLRVVRSQADPYERIRALIPDGSPLHDMSSLGEVEQYVRTTTLIPLDQTRLNPVFGSGKPDADIMVVGEAPGADEDAQGLPFVGRAGQLLTNILKAIEFERDEVYIANILKSRPPNNREPLPDEIAAHITILYKQIELIRPRILLCLGKTSANALLRTQASLGSLRGELRDFFGLPVVVTYHPAALLRNPQWKYPTWDDIRLLRAEYDRLAG